MLFILMKPMARCTLTPITTTEVYTFGHKNGENP